MTSGRIIATCWIIFLFYWIVSAGSVKATAERKSWSSSLPYKILIWIACILLFLRRLPGPLSSPALPDATIIAPLGAAICVLGLLGAIWARKTLAGNWSSDVTFKQDHKLIEQGPYQFVRHPIYTTILLMYLGTAVAANRIASSAGVLFCFIGFWIKLKQEEKLMAQHFPEEYPAYKARVKALIPFVL